MVVLVLMDEVSSYGIVDCNGVEILVGGLVEIVKMVEKLLKEEVLFNFVVVGCYVFLFVIWDLLEKILVGVGDEI